MYSDVSSRFEVLNKTNYDVWQVWMQSLLVKHDRWGYVNGEIKAPTVVPGNDATERELAKWKSNDAKAKADIVLSMGRAELKSVSKCETSKEVWQKLQSIHASKGPVRKIELLTDITSFRIEEDDDFREKLDRFANAVEQLEGMDIQIPNDMLVVLILKGLPPSYENFRCAIRSKDDLPEVDTLMGKISDEHRSRHIADNDDSNNALYTGHQYNRYRQKNKPKKKEKRKCFTCGKPDHFAANCPNRYRDIAKKVNEHSENFYVEVARTEEANIASLTTRWCLDSGCTAHMCANVELLTNARECSSMLNMANSASTVARLKGSVQLMASTNGDIIRQVNLHNTLLVEDLRTNLMSVSKITDGGREVLFRKDKAVIQDENGKVMLVADRIGDLYYLRESREQVKVTTTTDRIRSSDGIAAITESYLNNDANLWHARLGHLHMNAVVDLSRGRATGMKALSDGEIRCDVCPLGKLTAKPFTARAEKSSRILEIVHTDLCQPSKTRSEGGNRYFASFIDDFSGWCMLYLLKSKDQVFEAFKTYKSYVEKQTGTKIKALQSDNGREYCNRQFDDYLKREGIQRRLTVPYTPQQNGVAERFNRTIVDMARCLLIQSGLPAMYWGEAINTANYLRNRCPSRSHKGATPFELWHGKVPNLKHLRVFGAKAFILKKGPGRNKLDKKSIEGRLMGYSETAKAYRIRRYDTGKVETTRDVHIDEEYAMRKTDAISVDIDYLSLKEEDRGQSRSITSEGCHEGDETSPKLRRTRGRPRKAKTGNRGRPRKIYRYVSASSRASSCTSDRSYLSEGEQVPLESAEGAEDDVFEQARDEGRGEKRSLDTSLIPIDKRARCEENKPVTPLENTLFPEDEEEFMETNFIGESALTADVELDDAVHGTDSHEWKSAIADEVRSHLEHGTWELVRRPERGRVIGSRVILKNKTNASGEIERRKARIVARGFTQRPGFDFNETFAPVARLESVRLLAALSTEMGVKLQQMDVATAYLNGEIDEELYMEAPEMLKEALENIIRNERRDSDIHAKATKMLRSISLGEDVCRLRKAIYGLKQSGRKWYERLSATLKKLGLEPTISDPCLFQARKDGKIIMVAVYVDDLLAASNDENSMKELKDGLKQAFKIMDLGDAEYCLGIEIKQVEGKISLSQRRYIDELLKKFNMSNCNPQSTPASPTTKLRPGVDPEKCLKNPQYRELVGSLMYLSVATRPDIAYSVSVLSQFNERPNEEHWGAAKRVLRYLKGTTKLSLIYKRPVDKIIGYADADWGNDPADSKSYTGYAFILGGAAISWKSRKQRTVALSTTEAEFKALTEATKESMYLRGLIQELKIPQLSEGLIYCDNQGAVQLTTATKFHDRTKHVRIQFNFVREAVKNRAIQVMHTPSRSMIADAMTKPLPVATHTALIQALGLFEVI